MSPAVVIAILIGVGASWLFQERFRLSPGGFIAPGVLATLVDTPALLGWAGLALVAGWGVARAMERLTLLDATRRAALIHLTSMATTFAALELTAAGAALDPAQAALLLIAPGLAGVHADRQGLPMTAGGLVLVAASVRLLLIALWPEPQP